MEEKQKQQYYTAKQVQSILFLNVLSLSSIHNMIRKGQIPTQKYLKKHLIPAWWVDQELAKAAKAKTEVTE